MDAPTLLLVELTGGPLDGTTLVANSPDHDPRLDVWDDEDRAIAIFRDTNGGDCLLYTSPSPRDKKQTRMPSSA